jgi:hypothetical protein
MIAFTSLYALTINYNHENHECNAADGIVEGSKHSHALHATKQPHVTLENTQQLRTMLRRLKECPHPLKTKG